MMAHSPMALGGMLSWERPHCDPFRELLVNPVVAPYLEEVARSPPGWPGFWAGSFGGCFLCAVYTAWT